jgi:hypothetical protein
MLLLASALFIGSGCNKPRGEELGASALPAKQVKVTETVELRDGSSLPYGYWMKEGETIHVRVNAKGVSGRSVVATSIRDEEVVANVSPSPSKGEAVFSITRVGKQYALTRVWIENQGISCAETDESRQRDRSGGNTKSFACVDLVR